MFTNFKRVFAFAINDFSRNKGVSVATIFILIIATMLITGLVFFQGVSGYLTSEIQDKIDIAAYFRESTTEEDILGVRDEIIKMTPNIKSVDYVSKDQALVSFYERHKDNETLVQALEEVGANPFLPSLNITTNGDPVQYAQVANILQTSDFSKLIDNVDFSQKKDTIEKIYSITSGINTFGLLLSLVLAAVAMLVVFNTIKLAIENSREEIKTMRIVGASDQFVRGPFIVQGLIYGFGAFLFCIFISGTCAYFLSPWIRAVLPGFNMLGYFLTNWWIFVLIQLGFGMGVSVISAIIVVKKYLEI